MFSKIIEFFSLQKYDSFWRETSAQSFFCQPINKFISTCNSVGIHSAKAKIISEWLQKISFFIVTCLFISLPLPQFANDKQGLAVILVVAFLFWLTGRLIHNGKIVLTNSIDFLVIIFFAVNVIATCSSHYFAASMHGLLKLFVYVLAYFLFSSLLRGNYKRQTTIVFILILDAVLLSLYGLYQYKIGVAPLATWEDPSLETQVTRIYATLNNPNLFAGYLVPINMLSASLALGALTKRRWFLSIISAGLSLLLSIALILTGSRGGYLAIAAGYLALIVIGSAIMWRKGKTNRWLLIALLALTPLLIAVFIHKLPGFEQRFVSIFSGREHSSNSFRLNVWLSSIAMFKDNWLIGIGVGNQAFRLAYGLYMRSGFDALGTYCVPLEIAVESGIFGLLLFVLIVISLLARAHLLFWSNTSSEQHKQVMIKKYLTLSAAVALIALSMHGLVDTVFFRPQIQFIFFFLLALISDNSSCEKSP